MMILFDCPKQHKAFSNWQIVKRNTVMTGEVIPYVSPFVIFNKAELATISVNMKTEFELKNM